MSTRLIGPFTQVLTMEGLAKTGALRDEELKLVEDGGILVDDRHLIVEVGPFQDLVARADEIQHVEGPTVATPGLIDCHTHICWAGSRALDYARRLSGMTYQEIAAAGGGIKDTVRHTRDATCAELTRGIVERCQALEARGVTTCEVKSGYGLSTTDELKMLNAIQAAKKETRVSLIPTCLAAHVTPPEAPSADAYLEQVASELLPRVREEGLSKRVDIFVEENAFSVDSARRYLRRAKEMGFEITIHADQFSTGGAELAAELGALSADHLEASDKSAIAALQHSSVVPVVLPGASLGLGLPFAPARAILDAGLPLAIASDWNPGSAPNGDLLMQAAVLGASQKLTHAETWAALTVRAAQALGLNDRGVLAPGRRADIALFATHDYREILYRQGGCRLRNAAGLVKTQGATPSGHMHQTG